MVLCHPKAEHQKAAADYDKPKGCISPRSHRFPATAASEGHKKTVIFIRAKREGGLISSQLRTPLWAVALTPAHTKGPQSFLKSFMTLFIL